MGVHTWEIQKQSPQIQQQQLQQERFPLPDLSAAPQMKKVSPIECERKAPIRRPSFLQFPPRISLFLLIRNSVLSLLPPSFPPPCLRRNPRLIGRRK